MALRKYTRGSLNNLAAAFGLFSEKPVALDRIMKDANNSSFYSRIIKRLSCLDAFPEVLYHGDVQFVVMVRGRLNSPTVSSQSALLV